MKHLVLFRWLKRTGSYGPWVIHAECDHRQEALRIQRIAQDERIEPQDAQIAVVDMPYPDHFPEEIS